MKHKFKRKQMLSFLMAAILTAGSAGYAVQAEDAPAMNPQEMTSEAVKEDISDNDIAGAVTEALTEESKVFPLPEAKAAPERKEGVFIPEKQEAATTDIDISTSTDITVELADPSGEFFYTGGAVEPEFNVTEKKGEQSIPWEKEKDYTVQYENNKDAGTATAKITPVKSGYTGTKEVSFTIKPMDITEKLTAELTKPEEKLIYTGTEIKPELTVKKIISDTSTEDWKQDVDYTVAYENNINAGVNTAKAVVTPKSKNYTGTKTVTFSIEQKDINELDMKGNDKVYNGREMNASVTMKWNGKKLERAKDFKVGSYTNNINVGTATGVVTGIGNFKGTRTMTFEISPKNIAELSFSSVDSHFFDKTYHEPDVSITMDIVKNNKVIGKETLVKDKDHIITYTDNKKVGTAGIMIIGKGNYTGSRIITFKIRPESTRLLKLERGNKRIRATWEKKTKQVTGYVLQLSPKKNFSSSVKKVTLNKKTAQKLVKGLRSKKKYYVRVRTYKNVSGIKYYSKWSNKMSIKTR